MPRLKRFRSHVIDSAAARAAGLESIDASLDFGDGLTLARYQQAIANAQGKLAAYNQRLSHSDEAKLEVDAAESELRDLSERMLASVAGKFGHNSTEYTKAGGRPRARRRQPRQPRVSEAPTLVQVQKAA